jgi:hypothetical protein
MLIEFVKLIQSHRSSLPESTKCNCHQYLTLPKISLKQFQRKISKKLKEWPTLTEQIERTSSSFNSRCCQS